MEDGGGNVNVEAEELPNLASHHGAQPAPATAVDHEVNDLKAAIDASNLYELAHCPEIGVAFRASAKEATHRAHEQ